MKHYIAPDILCVEVKLSPLMAGSRTVPFDLTEDVKDEDGFAAAQYRSNLWGE